MKKYNRGYTAGVFDLFHIGHLNVLKGAKERCDYLIVGVSTDEVVKENKNKVPVIPYDQRADIVGAIKYVDEVVPQNAYDIDYKIKTAVEKQIDVMFVGSDWQGSDKWNKIETELKKIGVDVVYLPHTDGISSTLLKGKLEK